MSPLAEASHHEFNLDRVHPDTEGRRRRWNNSGRVAGGTRAPATALAVILALQLGGFLSPARQAQDDMSVEIQNSADLPTSEINRDVADVLSEAPNT